MTERATGDELVTVTQARRILGVGKEKVADLIREGTLPTQPNPLDKRYKLVRRRDVEALLARVPKSKAA